MKLNKLFNNKTVLSFEVFPPKRENDITTVYNTIDELKDLNPDFISVTYGAGGANNCTNTLKIASSIKNKHNIESVAHLPCINLCKNDVEDILEKFKSNGIENILALRGDMNPNIEPCTDFKYASELIEFINIKGDFNIIAACYPEGHSECKNILDDILNLKHKVDCGVNHLITQLFLDNDYFYRFRELTACAGINVPIEAGIMPVTNRAQIERMVSLCGISLPKKFIKVIEKFEYNPIALKDAGIAYAIDQIVDLTAQGVDGIHLYTMNKPDVAKKICSATENLINKK